MLICCIQLHFKVINTPKVQFKNQFNSKCNVRKLKIRISKYLSILYVYLLPITCLLPYSQHFTVNNSIL